LQDTPHPRTEWTVSLPQASDTRDTTATAINNLCTVKDYSSSLACACPALFVIDTVAKNIHRYSLSGEYNRNP